MSPDVPRLSRLSGDGLRLGERRDCPRHSRRPRDPGRRRREPRPRLHLSGLRRRFRADGDRRAAEAGTEKLVDVTRESLAEGIRHARAGNRLGEISHAIQTYIESRGFGVVREYVGHGVGREMHEEPQVPNYGPVDRGPVLKKGMVLALEPMVTMGDWRTRQMDDNWTVTTVDGSLAAHFEHTIAITDEEPQVLTVP